MDSDILAYSHRDIMLEVFYDLFQKEDDIMFVGLSVRVKFPNL